MMNYKTTLITGGNSGIGAQITKNLLVKGEKVNKGQVIALVGNSGKVSIPQLHFEIRDKNGPLNPLKYLP